MRCSPGWWAVPVATYCPSRMVEHPISKSTKPRFATRWVTLYINVLERRVIFPVFPRDIPMNGFQRLNASSLESRLEAKLLPVSVKVQPSEVVAHPSIPMHIRCTLSLAHSLARSLKWSAGAECIPIRRQLSLEIGSPLTYTVANGPQWIWYNRLWFNGIW